MSEKKFEIETIRHSLSHVMAAAVMEIFPDTKLGIGPAIDNGFYYDFDTSADKCGNDAEKCRISEDDFQKIEKKMRELINSDLKLERSEISADEAKKMFADQPYKLELVSDFGDEKISTYKLGEFEDLCRGPHVDSTADLKSAGWKLDKIAGAYWKGSEKNPMLTRIYALAFENPEELKKYEVIIQEAEKRDHRKIGQDIDLFSFHPEGPGFVFWHDRGWFIFQKLIEYWREIHRREKYQEVNTPVLLSAELWKTSKHWDNYRDKMFVAKTASDDDFTLGVKPMNCMGGILIYKNKIHSYRELPIKMGEIGLVHRNEGSGELHGLMRLRQFTQDDAHIFCRENQIKEEILKVLQLCFEVYKKFDLEIDHIELSTRPEKSTGSDEAWETAEKTMKEILAENKIEHKINEGDGAFYGPKFDFHLRDAIGRTWQCGTIQLDFAQPENFDLSYIDEKGEKVRPVMIHRVIYGAIERFLGIYLENTAGILPVWLVPTQAIILPISNKHFDYSGEIMAKLETAGIRAEIDDRNESIGKKIREAEMQKIPYMLIIGDKEIIANKVALRKLGAGDKGQVKISEIINEILK
ncbi:MAG: threonine--tRNA ligase [Candidatus Berkelbacteria bacterium]|nr:threonine--tRNA ligase [Candidatus Berkelbacteria bacterium]